MNKALEKDINKQYLEAVACYEVEIDKSPTVEKFANLAFLYWAFAAEQIEFNLPNNISDEWSIIGGEKFLPTLDKGLLNFQNNAELIFWKRYFSHRLFMEDFSEKDCKEILKTYGDRDSLVPYFFLYLFDKKSYLKEIFELRKMCLNKPTAKNLYISSFIGL